MRKRTSIVWQESKEDFIKRLIFCKTIAGVIHSYNFAISGASYKTINYRIDEENLGHLVSRGLNNRKGKPGANKAAPLENVLIYGKVVSNHKLKKRLVKEGLLNYICVKCGNNGVWMGEKISLHLDHINGDRLDNQIENLRILCPNCHSQTETHSGKNRRARCSDCNIKISSHSSKRCQKCANKLNAISSRKFDISKEELEKLVWEKPTAQIAKDFDVSDNAIGKRCKKFGINKPHRGYWTKNRINTKV